MSPGSSGTNTGEPGGPRRGGGNGSSVGSHGGIPGCASSRGAHGSVGTRDGANSPPGGVSGYVRAGPVSGGGGGGGGSSSRGGCARRSSRCRVSSPSKSNGLPKTAGSTSIHNPPGKPGGCGAMGRSEPVSAPKLPQSIHGGSGLVDIAAPPASANAREFEPLLQRELVLSAAGILRVLPVPFFPAAFHRFLRIRRRRAICRFAAAEPLTSRAVPRERERVRDFAAMPFFRRRRRFEVRAAPRRLRRRPPFLRAKACCINAACAPVTSPGMIKTDLSATH